MKSFKLLLFLACSSFYGFVRGHDNVPPLLQTSELSGDRIPSSEPPGPQSSVDADDTSNNDKNDVDFKIETSPWKSHLSLLYASFVSLSEFHQLPPFNLIEVRAVLSALFLRRMVQTIEEIEIEEKKRKEEYKDKEGLSSFGETIIKRINYSKHDIDLVNSFEKVYPILKTRVPESYINFVDNVISSQEIELRKEIKRNELSSHRKRNIGPFIGINSAFGFHQPRKLLIHSLLNIAKVPPDRLFVFIGGSHQESMTVSEEGYIIVNAKHNSIDFTALISVLETPFLNQFDWLILHDTCEVGLNFWKVILRKYNEVIVTSQQQQNNEINVDNHEKDKNEASISSSDHGDEVINISPISNYKDNERREVYVMPLAPEGSMNMGFYFSVAFKNPELILFLKLMKNEHYHVNNIAGNDNDDATVNATVNAPVSVDTIDDKQNDNLNMNPRKLKTNELLHDPVYVKAYKQLGIRAEDGAFRLLLTSSSSSSSSLQQRSEEYPSSQKQQPRHEEPDVFLTRNHPKGYQTPIKIYGGMLRQKILFEELDLIKYKANIDFRSENLFLDP